MTTIAQSPKAQAQNYIMQSQSINYLTQQTQIKTIPSGTKEPTTPHQKIQKEQSNQIGSQQNIPSQNLNLQQHQKVVRGSVAYVKMIKNADNSKLILQKQREEKIYKEKEKFIFEQFHQHNNIKNYYEKQNLQAEDISLKKEMDRLMEINKKKQNNLKDLEEKEQKLIEQNDYENSNSSMQKSYFTMSRMNQSSWYPDQEQLVYINSMHKMKKSLNNSILTLKQQTNSEQVFEGIQQLMQDQQKVHDMTEVQVDTMSQLEKKVDELKICIQEAEQITQDYQKGLEETYYRGQMTLQEKQQEKSDIYNEVKHLKHEITLLLIDIDKKKQIRDEQQAEIQKQEQKEKELISQLNESKYLINYIDSIEKLEKIFLSDLNEDEVIETYQKQETQLNMPTFLSLSNTKKKQLDTEESQYSQFKPKEDENERKDSERDLEQSQLDNSVISRQNTLKSNHNELNQNRNILVERLNQFYANHDKGPFQIIENLKLKLVSLKVLSQSLHQRYQELINMKQEKQLQIRELDDIILKCHGEEKSIINQKNQKDRTEDIAPPEDHESYKEWMRYHTLPVIQNKLKSKNKTIQEIYSQNNLEEDQDNYDEQNSSQMSLNLNNSQDYLQGQENGTNNQMDTQNFNDKLRINLGTNLDNSNHIRSSHLNKSFQEDKENNMQKKKNENEKSLNDEANQNFDQEDQEHGKEKQDQDQEKEENVQGQQKSREENPNNLQKLNQQNENQNSRTHQDQIEQNKDNEQNENEKNIMNSSKDKGEDNNDQQNKNNLIKNENNSNQNENNHSEQNENNNESQQQIQQQNEENVLNTSHRENQENESSSIKRLEKKQDDNQEKDTFQKQNESSPKSNHKMPQNLNNLKEQNLKENDELNILNNKIDNQKLSPKVQNSELQINSINQNMINNKPRASKENIKLLQQKQKNDEQEKKKQIQSNQDDESNQVFKKLEEQQKKVLEQNQTINQMQIYIAESSKLNKKQIRTKIDQYEKFGFKIFMNFIETLFRLSQMAIDISRKTKVLSDKQFEQFGEDLRIFVQNMRKGVAIKRNTGINKIQFIVQNPEPKFMETIAVRFERERTKSIITNNNNNTEDTQQQPSTPTAGTGYLPTSVNLNDNKKNRLERYLELFQYVPLDYSEIENIYIQIFPHQKQNCELFIKAIKNDIFLNFFESIESISEYLVNIATENQDEEEKGSLQAIKKIYQLKEQSQKLHWKNIKEIFEQYLKFQTTVNDKIQEMWVNSSMNLKRAFKNKIQKPDNKIQRKYFDFVIDKLRNYKNESHPLSEPITENKMINLKDLEESAKEKANTDDLKKIIFKLANSETSKKQRYGQIQESPSKKKNTNDNFNNHNTGNSVDDDEINLLDQNTKKQLRYQNMNEDQYLEYESRQVKNEAEGRDENQLSIMRNSSITKLHDKREFYQHKQTTSYQYLKSFVESDKVIWKLRKLENKKDFKDKFSSLQMDDYVPKNNEIIKRESFYVSKQQEVNKSDNKNDHLGFDEKKKKNHLNSKQTTQGQVETKYISIDKFKPNLDKNKLKLLKPISRGLLTDQKRFSTSTLLQSSNVLTSREKPNHQKNISQKLQNEKYSKQSLPQIAGVMTAKTNPSSQTNLKYQTTRDAYSSQSPPREITKGLQTKAENGKSQNISQNNYNNLLNAQEKPQEDLKIKITKQKPSKAFDKLVNFEKLYFGKK